VIGPFIDAVIFRKFHMRKILSALFLTGMPFLASAQSPTLAGRTPTPSSFPPQAAQATTALQDGGIHTPFSHEEENFYRRAWPVKESHAEQALLLIGVVFLTIISLVVWKMAQSGPRKPENK